MADWLDFYADAMELNVWCDTDFLGAQWNEAEKRWTVRVRRDSRELTLSPAHVVIATGISGHPRLPAIPGAETFLGEQQHSSQHAGAEGYSGQNVIVVGSNNSAHDISASLWEVGANVTMIQRSPTLVVRVDTHREISQAPLYSEEALAGGITTQKADLLFASVPYGLMPQFQSPRWTAIKERDREFYDQLVAAGFQLTFGPDGFGCT